MKKFLAMVLAIVMCLSLCACGSDKNVAGDYESVGFDVGSLIRLNEDGTYEDATPISAEEIEKLSWEFPDYSEEELKEWIFAERREKGTYEIEKDRVILTSSNHTDTKVFAEIQDSYYIGDDMFVLSYDAEHGQVPQFSKDGKCTQTFEYSEYKSFQYTLTFREDGTFLWYDASYPYEDNLTVFEGTYSLDGSILTLTASGRTHVFIYANDTIYMTVYKKVA